MRISLLRFFKTITKIWLMRFYGLFIFTLCENENERQKTEPVPIPFPRAAGSCFEAKKMKKKNC